MEKKDIEDLSNLVFGLALTVGALTLVQPTEDSFSKLLTILLSFALSFLVLLWFWWLYNQTMKGTVMDNRLKFGLNFLLLFLVVIEPYLLTIIYTISGGTAYALDLGTVMVIFVIFRQYMIKETPATDEDRIKRLKRSRNGMVLSAVVFYASTLIPLIPGVQSLGIQGLVWLLVLFVAILSRFRG